MANRRNVIIGVLGTAAMFAAGAWIVGTRIESPADAAARTAPPTPSPILVPIEKRELSANVVTRGKARYGLPQPIALAPSILKPSAGLITSLPIRNTRIVEGAVLLTASGRPVFVLQGNVPGYRDLGPGVIGEDVRQLEQGLKRLGYDPGPIDGRYDHATGAAVARWYKSKGWEPFGPTRQQLAELDALERDWGEATKVKLTAESAAAAVGVDSAQAAAEQSVNLAAAEVAAKKADLEKLRMASGQKALGVEAERAKADHANKAAAAEVSALIAERALIVLDPRQPETTRAAITAKLEMARAAASKIKLEGELAIQGAEREAHLAAEKLALAEGAMKAARLEGAKTVHAAMNARKLAELEVQLAAQRANRVGGALVKAKSRLGTQIPADELVFMPELPVRIEELSVSVGAPAAGPVLAVTNTQLVVDSSLTLDTAPLVRPGFPVRIDEEALGIQGKGVVEKVASAPGTHGVDGYHVYLEVRVVETANKLEGVSLRLTIPIKASQGAVWAVPLSALSLAADGTSRVQIQRNGKLEYVTVTPGLAADGYVEVVPKQGSFTPGQWVVVGYKTSAQSAGP